MILIDMPLPVNTKARTTIVSRISVALSSMHGFFYEFSALKSHARFVPVLWEILSFFALVSHSPLPSFCLSSPVFITMEFPTNCLLPFSTFVSLSQPGPVRFSKFAYHGLASRLVNIRQGVICAGNAVIDAASGHPINPY